MFTPAKLFISGGSSTGGGSGTITGGGADGQATYWVGPTEIAGNPNYLYAAPAVGAATLLSVAHDDDTSGASHARLIAQVGGTSGGDPLLYLNIPSGTAWYVGVDNSDSDQLKLGTGSAVGTNTIFTFSSTQSFTLNALRLGVSGIISQDNERLSVRYDAAVGDAALSSVGAFIQYTNSNNTNFTSFQRGIQADWRRAISSNTTDSGSTIAALGASPVFTVTGGGVTYTISSTFNTILVGSAALSGGGALAIATYTGIQVAANSVATGTRKVGVYIAAQTAATNNARFADNVSFSGTWNNSWSSTDASHHAGTFYIGGTAAHTLNTEKLSVQDTVSSGAFNQGCVVALLTCSGNTAASGSGNVVGVQGIAQRTITSGTTDTQGRIFGVIAQIGVTCTGVTYTNATTNGVGYFSTTGFVAPGGTLAITHFSGFNMSANSQVTGTNKYGVRIQSLTGANTMNVAFYCDNVSGATTNNAIRTNAGVVSFGDYMEFRQNADPGATGADLVKLGAQDASAGNRTFSLRTETSVAAGSLSVTHSVPILWNGTVYNLLLNA